MSELINFDTPLEEGEDIDALNDETFGCEIGEINDDWEEAHEKLASVIKEDSDDKDTSFINNGQLDQSKSSRVSFGNYNDSASSKKLTNQLDDIFPNCEDLIKKSISNFILDDDDFNNDDDEIYPNFASYEMESQQEICNSNLCSSQTKKKSINLESLRPPSPSILPFDDPFMSSVWRPLSPELNSNHHSNSQYNLTQSPIKEHSKIITLEELEKSLNLNGHQDTPSKIENVSLNKIKKAIRLEDLEASLLEGDNKTNLNQSPIHTGSPFMNVATNIHNNYPTSQPPPFMSEKMQPNMMQIAAMSLNQLALQNSQPPVIPPATKFVPPPPGLGGQFNMSQVKMPSSDGVKSMLPSISHPTNFPTQQKTSEYFQSQMVNPMVNVMSKLSVLPQPCSPKVLTPSGPIILNQLARQEQQRIIKKIITPAQAQRFYPTQMNNYWNYRNQDKFAGFMTQREKDWLIKIFRLQFKVNDPYVEDYYEVNFNIKKSALQRRATQQNNENGTFYDDSLLDSEPAFVLPELAKVAVNKPKYIQFDNALGKIQVLNTKCPRKLLEIDSNCSTYRLDSRSEGLLKIERLYEYLLKIEDEDKRMPILPQDVIQLHREKRFQLCKQLFDGLVIPIPNLNKEAGVYFTLIKRKIATLNCLEFEVNPQIMKSNKGLFLVYRTLFNLQDISQQLVLLCSLMKGSNYQDYVLEAEKQSKISYGNTLIKIISKINNTCNLIYIISGIEDIQVFTNQKYGYRLLVTLFKLFETSDDQLLFIYFWRKFVQVLLEHMKKGSDLHNLCQNHLEYLNEL